MGHSEFDPAAKAAAVERGRKLGAKRALKPKQVWAIRFWLDHQRRVRDRAMFDLAIDSKLRGCDVVKIRIGDLVSGGHVRARAIVIQRKTGRPVQFELLEPARASLLAWLEPEAVRSTTTRSQAGIDHAAHISTRQYARLVDEWVTGIGLRKEDYGTHSLRRTKASIIYKRPAICVRCRSCSAIPRSRARCATSALTSRTRYPGRRDRDLTVGLVGLMVAEPTQCASPDCADFV